MPVAHGRVASVTGSSRGLGAVIARRLARDGLAVAVNGRRSDGPAREVVGSIREDGGVAEAFGADITDEAQVAELVAAITSRFGPVDVLVLNATGSQPEAPVTAVTWAGHLAQLNFFVKSPVLLGRAVLPAMQARRYGRPSSSCGGGVTVAGALAAQPSGSVTSSYGSVTEAAWPCPRWRVWGSTGAGFRDHSRSSP
jgi:3-oxoacyl-[acyl-carrier protein] reductase